VPSFELEAAQSMAPLSPGAGEMNNFARYTDLPTSLSGILVFLGLLGVSLVIYCINKK
jgi:hypothetical protein